MGCNFSRKIELRKLSGVFPENSGYFLLLMLAATTNCIMFSNSQGIKLHSSTPHEVHMSSNSIRRQTAIVHRHDTGSSRWFSGQFLLCFLKFSDTNFRRYYSGKVLLFSGNFRRNSAGNFRTPIPRAKQSVRSCGALHPAFSQAIAVRQTAVADIIKLQLRAQDWQHFVDPLKCEW